jgi:hypothetical protein
MRAAVEVVLNFLRVAVATKFPLTISFGSSHSHVAFALPSRRDNRELTCIQPQALDSGATSTAKKALWILAGIGGALLLLAISIGYVSYCPHYEPCFEQFYLRGVIWGLLDSVI